MFFLFVDCQTSTNFKLASLGTRSAQERVLLVPDDNIGIYVQKLHPTLGRHPTEGGRAGGD